MPRRSFLKLTRDHRFRALNALSPGGVFKSIPVPSRLYHRHPSPEKPLSGVRLSISDTVSLQGTQTTLSSRAWTALHPDPATSSAEYARRLIELGAVIVGKTKISQFAAGGEWVDASAPWNPRADQYQRPSISSAGAAVAVAGYEWLQHAIGEDRM
jgi:Asp-tRNA(Asn)/Glu-tRNA(Gln) amidotransferase A subunit family amidase